MNTSEEMRKELGKILYIKVLDYQYGKLYRAEKFTIQLDHFIISQSTRKY